MPVSNKKNAFVIAPIGKIDSPIRKRADQIFKYVIAPIVKELGYEPVRADKIPKPGIITSQIIDHILNDPLVIADLTGHNPNVFYELAVRHTVKKPVIQIIQEGEIIPFDVSTYRTIQINHKDLDSVAKAKEDLRKQIKAVEKDPTLVDSPISMAVDLQFLKQSGDPESKSIADLTKMIYELSHMVKEIQYQTRASESDRLIGFEHYPPSSLSYSPPEEMIDSYYRRSFARGEPVCSVEKVGRNFIVTHGTTMTKFDSAKDANEYARKLIERKVIDEESRSKKKKTRKK
jgi:hypothetical protein